MKTVSEFVGKYGPWALVTGASSGNGAEFVRQLAAEGLSVVLRRAARSCFDALGDEISGHFGVQTRSVVVDLSEENSVERLGTAVADLDIGLIVSNAGTGNPGAISTMIMVSSCDCSAERTGASQYRAPVWPAPRRARRRRAAARWRDGAAHGIPFSANDASAKALVQSLGESLHVELRRKHIQVMTLVVPPTNTAIIEKFGLDAETMPMKPMSTTQCVSEALRAFPKAAPCACPAPPIGS